MSPFGKYEDFEDCVSKNSDKDDPEAYCAAIKRQVEGKSIGGFFKSAIKALEDILTLGGERPKAAKEATNEAPAGDQTQLQANTLTFTKDANGRLRWFGRVSGNFKDREREVFPAEVHREYVNHLEATKEYPELWLWHTPGTRFGVADWAEYDNGFLMMSGLVDAGKEAIADKVASFPNQGMSHGFKFRYREPRVIGQYRTYEVSVLPLEHCAFPWTKIEIQAKEKRPMRPEKLSYLESVLGKDQAAKVISEAETLQKSLVQQGVEWKDFDPEPPAPAPTAEALLNAFKATDEYKALAGLPEKLEAMAKAQGEGMAVLQASVKALQDENAALKAENQNIKADTKKTQDELVASAVRARGNVVIPSKSKENIVPPTDPLAAAKPKLPVDAGLAGSIGAVFGAPKPPNA